MKKRIICLLTLLAMLLLSLPMHIYANTVNVQEIFEKKVHVTEDGYKLNYRIYLPEDYSEEKEYPFILFFQGAGLKGNDNESQLNAGVQAMFTSSYGKVAQSIVVAPQCPLLNPDTAKWVDVPNWVDGCSYSTELIPESVHMRAVVDLLGDIKENYSTDESRWYVTGLSMGGFATWDIIIRHPEMWAAAVPLCGGADYRKAELIKDMPIWTFHGLNDPTVPYQGTEKMVNTLKELGSTKIKYNPMANFGHNIWDAVYPTPTLYTWLFSQSRPVSDTDTDTNIATEPITDEATVADTTEPQLQLSTENKGCGGAIGAGTVAVMATAGAAVVATRKKED
ncbi:MAG: prolyl oligopeptidase family serine peptidase [Clostridia bacterium]|nr:prolyl oligopeptidase family serine peptidase [Clostridia bacterium]